MKLYKIHNPQHKKTRLFTLIEVIVAILILGISLTSAFMISSSTTLNMEQAQQRWAQSHLFSLAAEFFLLFGENASLPSDLLPTGYHATCQLQYIESGEPAFAFENPEFNQWKLGSYLITLTDDKGTVLISKTIEKLVKNEE